MRAQSMLQVIYSFFLGLVVVGFVGVGTNTFYPYPKAPEGEFADFDRYYALTSTWSVNTSMIRVIIATVILLVSLVGSERYAVIANGLLLGGLFTMIYAVGLSAFSDASLSRFVIIGVALLIAVSIGWMRFTRVRTASRRDPEVPADLAEDRLATIEAKMDALSRALS